MLWCGVLWCGGCGGMVVVWWLLLVECGRCWGVLWCCGVWFGLVVVVVVVVVVICGIV